MLADPHARLATLIAIALGLVSIPVQSFFFERVAVVVTFAQWLVAHGVREHLHAIYRISDGIFWVCLFGLVLGVPLGLVARTHIFRYCLVYVVSQFLLYLVLSYWSDFGLEWLLAVVPTPTYWYSALGVLCFSSLVVWGKGRFFGVRRVAP
jgi:hypothetical protein